VVETITAVMIHTPDTRQRRRNTLIIIHLLLIALTTSQKLLLDYARCPLLDNAYCLLEVCGTFLLTSRTQSF
jgi:hypothetical protein